MTSTSSSQPSNPASANPSQSITPTQTKQPHYILTFHIPITHTESVCASVCKVSGAGSTPSGLYTEAFWRTKGIGQFRPSSAANPAIGSAGELETVEEDKVEMLCVGRECVELAVKELKRAHPYEEASYQVIKTEEF